MLNQAGAAGIQEAYFQLGSIYETGIDSIKTDVDMAQEYYKATSEMIKTAPEGEERWPSLFHGLTHRFQKVEHKGQSVPLEQKAQHWNSEIIAVKSTLLSKGW
jgi:hypothetical protein